jgi:hypothetical protein
VELYECRNWDSGEGRCRIWSIPICTQTITNPSILAFETVSHFSSEHAAYLTSKLPSDFIIIQQMTEDSVANASRMIAGVCGPLISLGRVQWDALCVGIIEVTSVGSDIFYERSHDVVPFERLRNLGGADILWEGCDGASALPTMAIRGLRENTTKVAILNLGDTLFRQGELVLEWNYHTWAPTTWCVDGEATIELRNGLAEHGITLVQFTSVYMLAVIFLMPHRFSLRLSQLGSVLL